MTLPRTRRLLALPAVPVLALGVLAGCGGGDGDGGGNGDGNGEGTSQEDGSGDGAGDGGSEGSSGAADDPDDPGDPDADIDLEDYEGFAGEVPDGFPEEVPLVDGDVQLGSEQSGVYAVAIGTDDDAEGTYDEAVELLVGAGFEEESAQEYDDVFTGSFSDGELSVQITTVTDEVSEGALITYAVSGG